MDRLGHEAEHGVAGRPNDRPVERNIRVVIPLLRRRIDPIVVLGLMQAWNAASCAPPLPAADVDRIVDSIAGRELARRARGHDE